MTKTSKYRKAIQRAKKLLKDRSVIDDKVVILAYSVCSIHSKEGFSLAGFIDDIGLNPCEFYTMEYGYIFRKNKLCEGISRTEMRRVGTRVTKILKKHPRYAVKAELISAVEQALKIRKEKSASDRSHLLITYVKTLRKIIEDASFKVEKAILIQAQEESFLLNKAAAKRLRSSTLKRSVKQDSRKVYAY